MATSFLSRVEREIGKINPVSSAGPGSYEKPSSINAAKPGFAPFSTSSRRVSETKRDEGPQGWYDVSQGLDKQAGVTSMFRSSGERFKDSRPDTEIGPGNYTLPSSFKSSNPKFSQRKTVELLNLVPSRRTALPPSIPTKTQSYGYEVRPDGTVAPQPPSVPGFTGHGNDTVGPADYQPNINTKFKSAPKPSFKGPERAQLDKLQYRDLEAAPGPGYYNTQSSFDILGSGNNFTDSDFLIHLNAAKRRQLSSFESKTARDPGFGNLKKRISEPGPGAYSIPPAIAAPQPKPENLQCFTTSEARFKDPLPRSMRLQTAPGSYNLLTSDFDQDRLKILKQKKMISRSQWASNVAFASTEQRLKEADCDMDIPSASAYYPKVGLADTVGKPNPRRGAFGSKGERFPEPIPERDRMTREEKTEIELNRDLQVFLSKDQDNARKNQHSTTPIKPKYSSAFAPSPDSRLQPIKSPPGPPPGAYDTAPKWIKQHSTIIAPELKLSRKKVFDPVPGPGDYNLGNAIKVNARNPKNVMVSSSKRSDLARASSGPGPGYYSTTPIVGSLIKQSHNILLYDKYQ